MEKGIFKEPLTAVIDSSPVHGAGAVASTYELVRKLMGRLARALGDNLDVGLAAKVLALAAAKPDIDWQDPAARKTHLGDLLELAGHRAGRARRPIRNWRLTPKWRRQPAFCPRSCSKTWKPPKKGAAIRQGVAPDRVVSHSDPEVRHGRKSASRRFDGHKLDVMIDEASEMVLGVEVRAGNAGDGEGAAPLLASVQSIAGIEVATLLADMAYSDGDVREAVEETGAELVAKVPPVTNSGRFPKTEFNIDLEAGTVTCPAGQATSDARPAKDHKGRPATMFYFQARTCEICPLRERCTAGRGGRTIMVGRHHRRIEAARAAQDNPGPRHCCAGGRKWNARSTTSRTSACAKPVTGAGAKPACKLSWPPPSPTSSDWACSACSRQPPSPPRRTERDDQAHQMPPSPALEPLQP